MKFSKLTPVGVALALGLSTQAMAQSYSLPNYGNFQDVEDNFRVGIQVFNPLSNVTTERSFGQSDIEDLEEYLDPSLITGVLTPTQYNQVSRYSGIFDLAGAPIEAGYDINSPVLEITFISPEDGSIVHDGDGNACVFTYNGATRQQSYDAFSADIDDEEGPTIERFAGCIGRSRASFSPVDPLVGNPFSLQGTMVRSALDLTEGDSLVEQEGGANSSGDPWIIGASFATGSAGRFDMNRIDARVAKGWRIMEGNRARLKLDLPFSYTRIKGEEAYTGQIGLGMEIPVKDQTWSLEPRVAYGLTGSPGLGSVGHIAQATVASRYAINGLGRGRLLIGNMAGYTFTLKTPGGLDLNPDVKNWVFRNGAAYEMPLNTRIGGRSTSMRASYTFSNFLGDDLYNNNFHEATLSFGLRGRENTPKQFRDLVRVNFATVQAKGFSTYTAGLGFRF